MIFFPKLQRELLEKLLKVFGSVSFAMATIWWVDVPTIYTEKQFRMEILQNPPKRIPVTYSWKRSMKSFSKSFWNVRDQIWF